MARQCNQDVNASISAIRLEINTDVSALYAYLTVSGAGLDINLNLNQHELYEMTMENICVGVVLNYEIWKNGRCFCYDNT